MGLGTPGAAMTPLLHPMASGGDLGGEGRGELELWRGVLVAVKGGEGPVAQVHSDGMLSVDGPEGRVEVSRLEVVLADVSKDARVRVM